ncbi:MAG TPA: L-serine ammonia-lyase [Caulobacteraceae bacterium]|nr:L-serine ammonia-lyase [Caulobacteraceae bacterium]
MTVSTFELFKPGVGPSSSHTMGPMTAGLRFVEQLAENGRLGQVGQVRVTLYGSLALTGRGHGTDRAVQLGLAGFAPATIDPDLADTAFAAIGDGGQLRLGGLHPIAFDANRDIVWAGRERLPGHPNALTIAAFDGAGEAVLTETYYSIGGGFVRSQEELDRPSIGDNGPPVPYVFASAAELLALAEVAELTIAELMAANEATLRPEDQVRAGLDEIVAAMEACIDRGLRQDGCLPGGLKVRRRAKQSLASIVARSEQPIVDPLAAMDWVNLWAMAVNEENAAGGRVVTAPTNGAAGIIPAVLRFYDRYHHGSVEGRRTFILTAAAIGALYKRNASISGAEVGCQGEVGVACSMAAAGLAAVLGGTNAQIENAAEIGMEHNLGLTCDPIGGLVQIPCIERNAMGAIKAIDAARLALLGDGQHSVSLDKVIATMKRTGADMNEIYKETSLGGLAVNVVEC